MPRSQFRGSLYSGTNTTAKGSATQVAFDHIKKHHLGVDDSAGTVTEYWELRQADGTVVKYTAAEIVEIDCRERIAYVGS